MHRGDMNGKEVQKGADICMLTGSFCCPHIIKQLIPMEINGC